MHIQNVFATDNNTISVTEDHGAFSDDLNNTVHLDSFSSSKSLEKVMCIQQENEIDLISDNFPNPYPPQMTKTWCFEFPQAVGINIETLEFDLDPQHDFLSITKGKPDEGNQEQETEQPTVSPNTIIYTGKEKQNFQIIDDNTVIITFKADNDETHKFKGFKIKISPIIQKSTEAPPTETPTPPAKTVDTLFKSLTITPEEQINPDTWNITIRGILVESTNEWLAMNDLNGTLEECKLTNVVIESVKPCPTSWPSNDQCVMLEFGIALNRTEDDFRVDNLDIIESGASIIVLNDYELSKVNLEKMWVEVGRQKMQEAGYAEYKLPNASITLLIWTSVSLFVIGVFIGILYGIWRMDFFKDYRRMSEEFGDTGSKRDSKLDLSMYPSPNQIVPPFLNEGDAFGESKLILLSRRRMY